MDLRKRMKEELASEGLLDMFKRSLRMQGVITKTAKESKQDAIDRKRAKERKSKELGVLGLIKGKKPVENCKTFLNYKTFESYLKLIEKIKNTKNISISDLEKMKSEFNINSFGFKYNDKSKVSEQKTEWNGDAIEDLETSKDYGSVFNGEPYAKNDDEYSPYYGEEEYIEDKLKRLIDHCTDVEYPTLNIFEVKNNKLIFGTLYLTFNGLHFDKIYKAGLTKNNLSWYSLSYSGYGIKDKESITIERNIELNEKDITSFHNFLQKFNQDDYRYNKEVCGYLPNNFKSETEETNSERLSNVIDEIFSNFVKLVKLIVKDIYDIKEISTEGHNMENVLETPEAQKLLYLINLTYKSMKFCGGLDSNIYTKDINSQEQEDMIKNLALSEVRKLLGI